MEENLKLSVSIREEKAKKNKKIREMGSVPAIVYGHGLKNIAVKVPLSEFIKIYNKAKESSLVDLIIDNQQPVKVLIQDVQKDPISDKFIHVDFYQVRMDEKIKAKILLNFVGEALAVKELGGVFVSNMDEVEVKCYPKDLVKEITVDISNLKTFNDYIYVKDLKLPAAIEVIDDKSLMVAQVTEPRSEEELKSLETEVKEDVDKVAAVEKKEKKDEEEAEGEAPAAGKPAATKEEKK
jgi:large subunit ribosomal protein L25